MRNGFFTHRQAACCARAARTFISVFLVLLSSVVGAMAAPAGGQTVLHVDGIAPPGGDGSTWGAAFSHPQQALDAALQSPGETFLIKVAQGRYVPTQRTDVNDPRSATFRMLNGVTLRGGYAGLAGSDPDAHDPEQFETILSGDINGDDLPGFINYGENVYHVLVGSSTNDTAVLEGFTVSGGNANVNAGIGAATHFGGGLYARPGSPKLSACVFSHNIALTGGGVYVRDGSLDLQDTQFRFNRADNKGAILLLGNGSGTAKLLRCRFYKNEDSTGVAHLQRLVYAEVADCEFLENTGTGLSTTDIPQIRLERSLFQHNHSAVAGGASLGGGTNGTVRDCVFSGNNATFAVGALTAAGNLVVSNCAFVDNVCNGFAGAVLVSQFTTFINCMFVQNTGYPGGAIYNNNGHVDVRNCTFHGNEEYAIVTLNSLESPSVTLRNSILWGNIPSHFSQAGSVSSDPQLSFCCVQGGWPGEGNINADPLFVRPGCDDLRLAHNSPCLDAGSNALIPPGVTTDLAGNPRIQNGTVDMGAYEGSFDPLPPAACVVGLDPSSVHRLVPTGGAFSPVDRAATVIVNESGPSDAFATVTQYFIPQHPQAAGYNELGDALVFETSLADGVHWSRIIIPFDHSNLNGFDPLEVDLTHYNAATGQWQLAVAGNVQNAPGQSGPVGNRIVVQGTPPNWGWSFLIGDHGVFWDPQAQRGFGWANVDHAGTYAVGIQLPQCAGDCSYPPDNKVNHFDLNIILSAWGATPTGPLSFADVNRDDIVNANDLLQVIHHWGACP